MQPAWHENKRWQNSIKAFGVDGVKGTRHIEPHVQGPQERNKMPHIIFKLKLEEM